MSEIVSIPFQGDQLQAVAGEDGKPMIVFKPFVEGLGLAYSSQLQGLKQQKWATVLLSNMVGPDGRTREMTVVPIRTLTMWLAGLTASRVAPHLRDKIEFYQAVESGSG